MKRRISSATIGSVSTESARRSSGESMPKRRGYAVFASVVISDLSE